MKLSYFAFALIAVVSTTATATTISFSDSSGSYASSGITATVSASGGALYYANNGILGSGVGVKSNILDTFGYLSAGESLTVTFNKTISLSGLTLSAWDGGGLDQITLSYGGGSQLLSSASSSLNLSLNSFTLSASGITTGVYLNKLDVAAVPVPGAAILLSSGIVALAGLGYRRKDV